jgi:hypothetical protein
MASPFASALLWTVALTSVSAQTPVNVAPNAAETLQYLNGAKPRLYTYGGSQESTPLALSGDRTRLILHSKDPEIGQTLDGQVDIRELDAMSVSVVHNDARSDVVQIACSKKRLCYTLVGHTPGMDPSFEPSSDSFYFWMTPDGDKADRMARALGHLVELLQAEYKSSHTSPVDPNDPFAKPPQ